MIASSFVKTLSILFIVSCVLVAVGTPILYGQIKAVVFNLNLEKNREQAERLATLVSIDLERGELAAEVLARVQNMLENTPQSSEHFACIVEDENRVIAHPKPSNVNKDVTGWTLANDTEVKTYTQSAGEGIPFGGIQTRLDGSQDITYQVPISTKPWSVAVHTKLDLVGQQTWLILEKVAWFILPILIAILLLTSFLITRNELKN